MDSPGAFDDLKVACPECGFEQIDVDGFGVMYCENCEFCIHPSLTDGVCLICGKEPPEHED